MSVSTRSKVDAGRASGFLNKVPEVTIFFWIIKICCTTVGETVADYLNVNLNLGLTGTSIITGVLLVAALAAQFLAKSYRPVRYWLTVAVVSVFGTLVTDNLTDKAHVALEKSAIIFAILLALTFIGLVRHGAHLVDPPDLHPTTRSLLLDGGAVLLRVGHGNG